MTQAYNLLSSLEEARLALIQLIDGWRGGEEGVVGGVEGGRAAVALLYRQRAGTILQGLRKGKEDQSAKGEERKIEEKRNCHSAEKNSWKSIYSMWSHLLDSMFHLTVLTLLWYVSILYVSQWACVLGILASAMPICWKSGQLA